MKCLQFITMKEGLYIDIMTSPYYNWSIPLTIPHPQSVVGPYTDNALLSQYSINTLSPNAALST